jgi:phenylacetate-CoA ligase
MGRTDDMFVFKGINVFPSQIECAIAEVPQLSPHYKVTLERDASFRDTALLEVEPVCSALTEAEQRSVLAQLEARLREIIIVRLNAVLREPGTLERFAGKARRVDDRRYDRE